MDIELVALAWVSVDDELCCSMVFLMVSLCGLHLKLITRAQDGSVGL